MVMNKYDKLMYKIGLRAQKLKDFLKSENLTGERKDILKVRLDEYKSLENFTKMQEEDKEKIND